MSILKMWKLRITFPEAARKSVAFDLKDLTQGPQNNQAFALYFPHYRSPGGKVWSTVKYVIDQLKKGNGFIAFGRRAWQKPVKLVSDGTIGLQNPPALTLGLK